MDSEICHKCGGNITDGPKNKSFVRMRVDG